MTDENTMPVEKFAQAGEKIQSLRASINQVLIGQEAVVDQVVAALLANGHVLIEGVPGLGKTLLVSTLAKCFSGEFKRIQFTPDLMPADITGHSMFDMKEGEFHVRKGPIFTNLLLADEINRAPAKTQAALLEVMQEKQVTIEGEALEVPLPFMVLATQNPIEQEGTYPLPEAELDRFVMKVFIDYPSHEDEIRLTSEVTQGKTEQQIDGLSSSPMLTAQSVADLQALVQQVRVDDQVMDYAVRLARATRESAAIVKGAGPRASIALITTARANALLRGSDYVLPDDVKAMVKPVMRHRIILSADMEIDGQTPDHILDQLLQSVEAPR